VQGQKRFLGDIAHELRSPLGRMQVALSILEEKVKPEDKTHLRDLQEEVEFMSGLTTELLTFARAEMRPEAIKLAPLNLRHIVERAVEVESSQSDEVRIEIDPSLQVVGDEEYLFRAFSNVIRNSIRYAGGDGPINITARRQDDHVAARKNIHTVFPPGSCAGSQDRWNRPRPGDRSKLCRGVPRLGDCRQSEASGIRRYRGVEGGITRRLS
jgi:signal transduction histidine kinase